MQLFRYSSCLRFPFVDRPVPTGKGDSPLLPQVIVGESIGGGAGDLLQAQGVELQLQRIWSLWHYSGELEVDQLQTCLRFQRAVQPAGYLYPFRSHREVLLQRHRTS